MRTILGRPSGRTWYRTKYQGRKQAENQNCSLGDLVGPFGVTVKTELSGNNDELLFFYMLSMRTCMISKQRCLVHS